MSFFSVLLFGCRIGSSFSFSLEVRIVLLKEATSQVARRLKREFCLQYLCALFRALFHSLSQTPFCNLPADKLFLPIPLRFGFLPIRNGCNEQLTDGHNLTSSGLPPQQSKHLARIAFTGVICILSPPFIFIIHDLPCKVHWRFARILV